MNTLPSISSICEKYGIYNVADIPFERTERYIEISRTDFLNLLMEIHNSGINTEKENEYGEY